MRHGATTYDEVKALFDKWNIPYTEDTAFLSNDKELVFTNINGANVVLNFHHDYYNGGGREWITRNAEIPSACVHVSDVDSVVVFTGSMHNDVEFLDDRGHSVAYVQIKDVV